jgi:Uma2 family endonuclease
MSHSAARTTPPPELDPLPYGWRYVKKVLPDGTTRLVQVPLTLEDTLHPQEGDEIPERLVHNLDAQYLGPVFRARARERLPNGLVLVDCLVDWGVPGIRNHSPDLSAFKGVINPPPGLDIGTFRLRDSGGRCVLALEIVSPDRRDNDVVEKFREYHQVRVPLYVLIDQRTSGGPREIIGYRYTPGRYVRMRLDRQGRLPLKPLGLLLGLEDNRAVCYDADTGERLGVYVGGGQGREQERQAREAAEQRVRELEAELRRLRGQ